MLKSLLALFIFSIVAQAAPRRDAPYLKSKNFYVVPQAYLDKLILNLETVLKTAKAVPEVGPDNQLKGFKVTLVEKGSEFKKLGIEKNDLLVQINDVTLSEPIKALEAFQSIRTANPVKVHLLRKNQKVVLTYQKEPAIPRPQ
jgi:type II secretory pathway component PulC